MNDNPALEQEDEISLYDIYLFIKEGWKTIASTTLVGGALGLAGAFLWPSSYEASASIASTKVMGTEIEPISVLVEKLKLPTYYSAKTLAACKATAEADPGAYLVKSLSPSLQKQSIFLSLSFKAKSPEDAKSCIDEVLVDINNNQKAIAAPLIRQAQDKIRSDEQKLLLAEKFVTEISDKALSFKFNDLQFSASSLLTLTLQAKQNEVVELNNSIRTTKQSLEVPLTLPARYAAPVYAPNLKVSPKRSLILAIGILLGGFAGFLCLFGKRIVKSIREEELRRQKLNL